MLRLSYLYENYALAKEALRHYRHDTDTLDEMLRHFRVSSNAVYPYRADGQTCFLRLSPVSEKKEENLRGELEFIGYLCKNGYPAAAPIPADTGETLLTLDTAWGAYYVSAFTGAPGVRMDRTELSDRILFAAGVSLARLHTLSRAFQPSVQKWDYASVLDWDEAVLTDCHAPDFVFLELAAVRSALDALPRTAENYGLVHEDFEPDNLFWDETAQRCHVIDFEDSMMHFYALDLVRALDALGEEIENAARLAAARTAFLAGYRSVRGDTAQTEALFPLMRRFIELNAYARLIRVFDPEQPGEPEWMLELRKKLKNAVARREAAIAAYVRG